MPLRNYTELCLLDSYEARYEYLRLEGTVADRTFGSERYLNQSFYRSAQWKEIRNFVIVRDEGLDLAFPGQEIFSRIYIHHMNPMRPEDLVHGNDDILNPEYLISVSHTTHNAIHYGTERHLPRQLVERSPGDHLPWRNNA